MKKIYSALLVLATIFGFVSLSCASAIAQDACSGISGSAYCSEIKKDSNPLFGSDGIGTKITQILTIVSGLVSVIVIILGGIKFISSSGEPQKIASAKNTIIYASVGVVVSLLAQAVVLFVLSKL